MSAAPKFKNNVKISERHGAGEWKLEKLALLALMALGLWARARRAAGSATG